MPPSANPWVTTPTPNPKAALRLFCFHYAGGGTTIFHPWPAALPGEIEMCPVRLPGRESRLVEKPFVALPELLAPLTQGIRPLLDKPFAFYGHSMGGFVSFELARHLRGVGAPLPHQLFISGCRALHLPDPEPPVVHLPDAEFVQQLRRLNGTPDAVFQNPELLQLLLPCIRADFRLVESYQFKAGAPLDIPIVAFGGSQDPKANRSLMEPWAVHTTREFVLHMMDGDHFFIHNQRDLFLRLLADAIRQLLRQQVPS